MTARPHERNCFLYNTVKEKKKEKHSFLMRQKETQSNVYTTVSITGQFYYVEHFH